MVFHRSLTAIAAGVLMNSCVGVASAQEWSFALDTGESGLTGPIGLDGATSGTLVGDYDPVENPGGTRTRQTGNPFALPGPMQNDAIPASATFSADLDTGTQASGAFVLGLDGADVTMSGLSVDLLSGSALNVPVNAAVSFASFTTANPTSFYPSLPLTLPIGEVSLNALTATQSGGAVVGSAAPDGAGGFDATLAVPVLIEGSASFQGQSFVLDPMEAILPVMGNLMVDPGGAFFVGGADLALMETLDIGVEIPTFPLALPTLGGGSADVLLSLTFDSITAEFDVSIGFEANGTVVPAPGGATVTVLGALWMCGRRRRIS